MKKMMIIVLLIGLETFAIACSTSKGAPTSGTATAAASADPAAPPPAAAAHDGAGKDEIPAAVRHAFPDANSITMQHKDLSSAQIASIEKQSGMKIVDKDHHSYVAFATEGGPRKQTGVATIVKAQGREMVIVYASEGGSPVIKEVHAEGSGLPEAFLNQFNGKGHDDRLRLGQDIKLQGVDEALARAVTDSIRLDVMTVQALYGSAHTHPGAHKH